LTADAPQFAQDIARIIGESLAWSFERTIIRGSGAGQPFGLLNSDAAIEVAKETAPAQAAGTFNFNNAAKMLSALVPSGRARAVWIVSPTVLPEILAMTVKVANTAKTDWVGGSAAPISFEGGRLTLLGLPVIVSEHCEVLGTSGDVILADLSVYYTLAKGGIRVESSPHAAFASDESLVRGIFRADGQPAISSPYTLADGSTKLSPFVKLATRS
jgi:HK97 family phage major capsid protein